MNRLGPSYIKILSLSLGMAMTLSSTPLFAASEDSPSVADCHYQAMKNGDGTGRMQISAACADVFRPLASPSANASSEDGLISVFGYRNILFTELHALGLLHRNTLAGNQTGLDDIHGVTLDQKNRETYVINGSPTSILVFRVDFSGNIAPIRRLVGMPFWKVTAVAPDPVNNELYIATGREAHIEVFSRLADLNGRRPENSTAMRRSLAGANTGIVSADGVAVDPKHNELFVLDGSGHQILVFNRLAAGNTPAIRTISGPSTQLADPVAIEFRASADEIQVTDKDGTILLFNRKSDGDSAPVTSR